MSNVIYVIPWVICDTENVFIKKTNNDEKHPVAAGDEFEEWVIKDVIPNPDRRSKDLFAVVDVYKGAFEKNVDAKNRPIVSLTNSKQKVKSLGFVKASEDEKTFIKEKVLKIKGSAQSTKKAKGKR